ncbi:MAG: T9SS type A sorting domain-containing protein, partial [Bacteroidota bacterium]
GDSDFMLTGDIYDTEGGPLKPKQTTFFENQNGEFSSSNLIFAPNNGTHAWGDYDNDGDPDLLTGNNDLLSPIHTPIFENQGGIFASVVQTLDDYKVQFAYFGDYDNDDDLDILAVVENEDESLTARIFKNNSIAKNDAPTAPTNLFVSINDDIVTFSWDSANDEETPTQALTYNLRIGTTPGGSEIMSAPALSNGTLLLAREGNVRQNTSWPIRSLAEGTYYWSVQAVDQGYKGSAFATEQMVSLPDGTIPVELTGFAGKLDGDHVALRWHTASETNNAGFSVERAIDEGTFESITFIEGHGTTTLPQSYRYQDDLLGLAKEALHYRLKQIDFDGAFAYSDVVTIALPIPEQTVLLPNHPNPFNPVTTINYTLSQASQVEVEVYDLTGKRIKTLVDSFQDAGRQQVTFDGTGLASGVYMTVLRTAKGVDMRKIVLLK